jgi:hypothetical protein
MSEFSFSNANADKQNKLFYCKYKFFLLYNLLVNSMLIKHKFFLGGVIVNILALSMEDYGFYPICKKL